MQPHLLQRKVKRRISWWNGCQLKAWESWMSTPAQAQPCCLALHKSPTSHRYNDMDIAGSWEEVHDTSRVAAENEAPMNRFGTRRHIQRWLPTKARGGAKRQEQSSPRSPLFGSRSSAAAAGCGQQGAGSPSPDPAPAAA